jgi:hypothetical protein
LHHGTGWRHSGLRHSPSLVSLSLVFPPTLRRYHHSRPLCSSLIFCVDFARHGSCAIFCIMAPVGDTAGCCTVSPPLPGFPSCSLRRYDSATTPVSYALHLSSALVLCDTIPAASFASRHRLATQWVAAPSLPLSPVSLRVPFDATTPPLLLSLTLSAHLLR